MLAVKSTVEGGCEYMREDIKERIKLVRDIAIPDGFKRTKQGILPKQWKQEKIMNILKKVGEPVTVEPDRHYVQIGIRSHGKGLFHKEPVSGKELGNKAVFWLEPHCLVVNIVFAWEQAVGITSEREIGLIGSHRFPMYSPKDNKVDIEYLLHFLMTRRGKKILEEASPGGAGRNKTLGQERFAKSEIIIPPIREQRKIVEILNHCDKIIRLKQQLIVEEQNRKKWLTENLFDSTSGVRLPGFIGKWKRATLGQLFEFGASLSASRADLSDKGICYLHYGDIHSNKSGIINVQLEFDKIPKIDTDKRPSKMLEHGDVVFVDASEDYEGTSKHVIVLNPDNTPFISGLHTIPARAKSEDLTVAFRMHCFKTTAFKKQVAFYVSGMKIFGLNKNNLAKTSITYPENTEQEAIAHVLSASDKKIELLEQELAQWQQKKKSLMQLLLTGIVRVPV